MDERDRPFTYLPVTQHPAGTMALHMRTAGDPSALAAAVRAAAVEIDPAVPMFNLAPLASHVTAATFQQRLAANLLTVFGGLALLLASIGAYGVLAWLVGQRRREIGVRLAIGASRGAVFRLIFGNGTLLVLGGIGVGLALSAAASTALASLLVGVSPFDLFDGRRRAVRRGCGSVCGAGETRVGARPGRDAARGMMRRRRGEGCRESGRPAAGGD